MLKKERFYSNPGSPIHDIYGPVVGENGEVYLEKQGEENIQEFIDSFRDSTDIHVIVKRIQAGEEELLRKRPGSFGDFTQMPKTYAEALQLQIDAKNTFDGLSEDVKAKFNYDPNQFFAQAGTKDWFEKIEKDIPKEVVDSLKPKESEFVVDES